MTETMQLILVLLVGVAWGVMVRLILKYEARHMVYREKDLPSRILRR